jgi:hypothetical protein
MTALGKFLFKPSALHFICERIESIGSISVGEYFTVRRGYTMAGWMTVVTATHLALLLMDKFLNFPRKSLALARLFFN